MHITWESIEPNARKFFWHKRLIRIWSITSLSEKQHGLEKAAEGCCFYVLTSLWVRLFAIILCIWTAVGNSCIPDIDPTMTVWAGVGGYWSPPRVDIVCPLPPRTSLAHSVCELWPIITLKDTFVASEGLCQMYCNFSLLWLQRVLTYLYTMMNETSETSSLTSCTIAQQFYPAAWWNIVIQMMALSRCVSFSVGENYKLRRVCIHNFCGYAEMQLYALRNWIKKI